MALDATRLGAAMRAAVDAAAAGAAAEDIDRGAMFQALAAAIITEFQANAVVLTTVSTTGSATAQTGAGVGNPTGAPPTGGIF